MKDDIITDILQKVAFRNEELPREEEIWNDILYALRARQRRRIRNAWWQAAAAVTVIVCTVLGFGAQVRIDSGADPRQISLPDGSSVELVAHSSIRYNRIGWAFARNLRLKGDATFAVTEGRRFRVKAAIGTVTVLGTRFTVVQDDRMLHVACFEGSVNVQTDAGARVLRPGDQVECTEREMVFSRIPAPRPEYLEYENTPLAVILREIETLYGLEISGFESCGDITFTGYVSTANRQEAMEVLFGCCSVVYTLEGNKLTIGH